MHKTKLDHTAVSSATNTEQGIREAFRRVGNETLGKWSHDQNWRIVSTTVTAIPGTESVIVTMTSVGFTVRPDGTETFPGYAEFKQRKKNEKQNPV